MSGLSYYKSYKGSAIFAVLILLGVISSLVAVIINASQESILLTQKYEKNSKMLLQIQSVEDFAINVLNLDRAQNSEYSHINQAWNTPVSNFSLGPYILNATLYDRNAKLNLNNLIIQNQPISNQDLININYVYLESFVRLFEILNIETDKLYALIDWIDNNDDIYSSSGAEDQFYLQKNPPYRAANNMILNLDELRLIRGFDAETVKKMKPYVSAIPSRSLININTAEENVLRSLHGVIGPTFASLIHKRVNDQPFKTIDEFKIFLLDKLRLDIVTVNQISSLVTTKSSDYLLEAKIIYENSFIDFKTSINLKKGNERSQKYNRIIYKIDQIK